MSYKIQHYLTSYTEILCFTKKREWTLIVDQSIFTTEVSELHHRMHIDSDFKCFRDIHHYIIPHSLWVISKSKLEIMPKKAKHALFSKNIVKFQNAYHVAVI